MKKDRIQVARWRSPSRGMILLMLLVGGICCHLFLFTDLSPASGSLVTVPSDVATIRHRLEFENKRLTGEVNRKEKEIARLDYRNGWKTETLLIMRGILDDDPALLEQSKTANKTRPEPFEFINWRNPDFVIDWMIRDNKYKCLEWVMSQPRWNSCLSLEIYHKVRIYTEAPSGFEEKAESIGSIFNSIVL
ncbi:MAG TPA: hypothetical protein QGH16_07810 [Verrucomicrobiota bacterium]|nr:hypothetical protein [Verrucomicrobiota bacterium]